MKLVQIQPAVRQEEIVAMGFNFLFRNSLERIIYTKLFLAVISLTVAQPAERCYVCAQAASDEECNARNMTCQTGETKVCLASLRQENGKSYLFKSCKQKNACENLQRQNEIFCKAERRVAVCFRCCEGDICNRIVEWPELEKENERLQSNVFLWRRSPSFLAQRSERMQRKFTKLRPKQKKRNNKIRPKKKISFLKQNVKKSAFLGTRSNRLSFLLRKPIYVDDPVPIDQVVLFSSAQSDLSAATAMMMSAAPPSCGIPSLLGISFVKLGSWPTGASFVVRIMQPLTATQGWAVLIAFTQALPSSCVFNTWVAKIYQEDPTRKAFIVENQVYNPDISMYAEFNVTFIIQNCPSGFTASLNAGVAAFYDSSLTGGQCIRQVLTASTTLPVATATPTAATTTVPTTTSAATLLTTIPTVTSATTTTTATSATTTTTATSATTMPAVTSATTTPAPTLTTTAATTTTLSTATSAAVTSPLTTTLSTNPATTTGSTTCVQQPVNSAYALLGPVFPSYQNDFRTHARVNMTDMLNVNHNNWAIKLVFNMPVKFILAWQVSVLGSSADGLVFLVGPHSWYNVLVGLRSFDIFVSSSGLFTPTAAVYYCDDGSKADLLQPPNPVFPYAPVISPPASSAFPTVASPQSTTVQPQDCNGIRGLLPPVSKETVVNFTPSPASDNLLYDYNEVLHKSLLFYEAQRSGKLPANNRVYWRGESNLHDGCDAGVDLTGGWYDGAENVKYGFPLAATVTLLAWGMIEFEEGYRDAQEWNFALENLKWGADYIVKTHTAPNTLWGQVGNPIIDQSTWTRPEELNTPRTSYQINETFPGSDLAGESAAALAACSIIFKDDLKYSALLLQHATQLYKFADTYRGHYDAVITTAGRVYPSLSGFNDELVWAAIWLFKATGDKTYLDDAMKKRIEFGLFKRPYDFSWDNKLAGIQVLLANITGQDSDRGDIENFLNHCITGTSVPRTPGGLAFFSTFGSNGYAANAAFIALVASKLTPALANQRRYVDFAVAQIHAMLGSGDGGRSYVVGFGNNPPTQPYHAASSCPQWSSPPFPCDKTSFTSAAPNPHTLYGALVAGPDRAGSYSPNRKEFIYNEVSINYNAGFQSAVAGLKYFVVKKRTP